MDLGAWYVFTMADPAGPECSQFLLRPEAVDQKTTWLVRLRNAPQSPAARNILRLLERLDHAGRSASPPSRAAMTTSATFDRLADETLRTTPQHLGELAAMRRYALGRSHTQRLNHLLAV